MLSCGNDSHEGNIHRRTLSRGYFPLFPLVQFDRSAEALTVFLQHYQDYNATKKSNNRKNTYLLPPWCRVLPEKLTVLQLLKKFPAFHGTRRFITALTSVRHLSLSWASPIQSTYPHPTYWRSILILSTHLPLGLPSVLFPSVFPTKTLYTPLSSPIHAT